MNNSDRQNLKLLSTFHYLMGGFSIITHLTSIVFWMGFFFPEFQFASEATDKTTWAIFFLPVFFLLLGLLYSVGLIASGRFLAARVNYSFTLGIACFSCLYAPLGTVLGVFTIIVLMRDSVKELYGISN